MALETSKYAGGLSTLGRISIVAVKIIYEHEEKLIFCLKNIGTLMLFTIDKGEYFTAQLLWILMESK